MGCRNVAKKHLYGKNIIIIEEREEKNLKNLQLSHIFVAILCHLQTASKLIACAVGL
jgi:hypothetical protein